MIVLDVISLVVALVAVAFAAIAITRARVATERASAAESAARRAEISAQAAVTGESQLETQMVQARQDAASAAQHAARAAAVATQASAAAVASRHEAEDALDRADRAAKQARGAADALQQAKEESAIERTDASRTAAEAIPRAKVARAEDHDVAGEVTGNTERVVRVSWELEHVRGSIWRLRNAGLTVAHEALLSDVTVPPKFVRPDEVIPRDVDRGDVLQLRVTGGRGAPPPRVRVTWREEKGSPAYTREFTVLSAS